jgi:dipeptidyl aminopeptidase/acylaminoacyl peptidase
VIASLALIVVHDAAAHPQRPFTVRDSIEMTRLMRPPFLSGFGAPPVFEFSPDGQRIVFVLRRGNLTTGRNEYSLIGVNAHELLTFVNSSTGTLPSQSVLARFEVGPAPTLDERDGIELIQWAPDSKAVFFVGRSATGAGRVYSVDADGRELHPITPADFDIASFEVSMNGRRVVFSAYSPPDWSARNAYGYAVGADYAYVLGKQNPQEVADFNLKLFVMDRGSEEIRSIAMPPSDLVPPDIAIDPSGRWAVIPAPILRQPAQWQEYDFIRANPNAKVIRDSEIKFADSAGGGRDSLRSRYYLADLGSGTARPLLDAPSYLYHRVVKARWSPDGGTVLLPPTYLPLSDQPPAERKLRGSLQAVVTVEISTGVIRQLFAVAGHGMEPRSDTLIGMEWTSQRGIALTFADNGMTSAFAHGVRERFVRNGSGWKHDETQRALLVTPSGASSERLDIRVAQDLNTPPEISVRDRKTNRERVVTDLNPQLRAIALGRVKIFKWTDRFNRTFSGGLVLPPDYRPGKRYPVVLQQNDFDPDAFLLDSSDDFMSPHAAQALAGEGILVLQMSDDASLPGFSVDAEIRPRNRTGKERFEDYGELPRHLASIEAAIDQLDGQGLIDRARVGLVGFSRMGMRVHYAVTFSRYPIAAATIADSVSLTPYCYASFYSAPYPGGMNSFDSDKGNYTTVGAPLWGADNVRRWTERSYLFNLDRIHTPIRYETYGTIQVPCNWEPFAILRRMDRPAEMIHIPYAGHNLKTPPAVMMSKGGNVDWFRFWLKDEEDDSDGSKADQYRRWRELREQFRRHSDNADDVHGDIGNQKPLATE